MMFDHDEPTSKYDTATVTGFAKFCLWGSTLSHGKKLCEEAPL